MNHRFTLSIFTMEINGTPTVTLQAKRHKDAESLWQQDRLRTYLSTLTSNSSPLWDASAIMKVRLAGPVQERLGFTVFTIFSERPGPCHDQLGPQSD
jgi:hypothetical protein